MKFYLESVENTFKEVSSDPHGLSAQEAEARLQKYGKNKLAEGKKVTLLQRFLEQLSDPMLIILMVAAVVSGITNYLSGESPVDVFIIMFVVILNSVLGVIQESKAEKAIEALKEMSAATSKVYRDGMLKTLKIVKFSLLRVIQPEVPQRQQEAVQHRRFFLLEARFSM